MSDHGSTALAVTYIGYGFKNPTNLGLESQFKSDIHVYLGHHNSVNLSCLLQSSRTYLKMAEETKLHSMLEKMSHSHDNKPEFPGADKPRPDIALGIVTVSRNRHFIDNYEPHYLSQVGTLPI